MFFDQKCREKSWKDHEHYFIIEKQTITELFSKQNCWEWITVYNSIWPPIHWVIHVFLQVSLFTRPPQKRSRQSLNRLNLLYFCVAMCGSFQRMDDTMYFFIQKVSKGWQKKTKSVSWMGRTLNVWL